VGRDRNDDDAVTDASVEIDTSSIAEITLSSAGEAPITVAADSASPADSEPRTLEPRMTVRGLARSPSPGHGDDEDDKTTQNLEERLLDVIAAEQRASRASMAKVPAFGPIITPSEPFRVTSPASGVASVSALDAAPTANTLSGASVVVPTQPAGTAPAARSNDTDPDISDTTAKRPPIDTEVEEEETVTDARLSLAPDEVLEELAETQDPVREQQREQREEPDEPEDETKTQTTQDIAVGALLDAMPAARAEVLAGHASADADAHAPAPVQGSARGEGGVVGSAASVRLELPKRGSTLHYDDPRLRPPTPAPLPHATVRQSAQLAAPATSQRAVPVHFPPSVPVLATPANPYAPTHAQFAALAPPTGTMALPVPPPQPVPLPPPPPATTARARPKKRRGSGRVLTVLFLFSLAAAGGALYRSKYRPAWMNVARARMIALLDRLKSAPAAVAPAPAAPASTGPAPAMDASAGDAGAGHANAHHAGAVDAAAADAAAPDASAPDAGAGDAGAGPVPSASASSSARGRGRGRPPRK
jgi:hypothetical protein